MRLDEEEKEQTMGTRMKEGEEPEEEIYEEQGRRMSTGGRGTEEK